MIATLSILGDEAALVARACADPAAFAAIYDHYCPRIFSYVRYRVADAATADDLTAHVFERALARIASYDPARAPFAVWLFAIARNAVNDHGRALARRRWFSLDALREHPSDAPPPDAALIASDERAALLAAVARLSARERDLLALKFGAQLPNRRIAELTGLSESNVGVILYRAVQRLRAALVAKELDNE